jgi:hypothetical protein
MRNSQQRISCDQRSCKTQNAAADSDAANSRAELLKPKYAHDAFGQRSAIRSHRQCRSATPLFHHGQSARVFDGVAADRDRRFVAAMLAFGANALVQPPDCRMIEQKRFDTDLEHIHKGIEPLDVRELVCNNGP